jgi:hypothetical protein
VYLVSGARSVSVNDCWFGGAGRSVHVESNSSRFRFLENHFYGQNAGSIEISGATDFLIVNNTIEKNNHDGSAVWFNGCRNAIVRSNLFLDGRPRNYLRFENCSSCSVVENRGKGNPRDTWFAVKDSPEIIERDNVFMRVK